MPYVDRDQDGRIVGIYAVAQREDQEYVDGDVQLQPAPMVPTEVTMRQARLALLSAGLLAQVDAVINALPEPQRSAARISWDYSSVVQRTQSWTVQLASAMGLTDAQQDNLFTVAKTL
jgi:hypothetical protein